MMSVLDHANMAKMDIPRSTIKWIGIRINQRTLRRWSRRYHPLPTCDLGLQEAISENRDHSDRIKDEDQQHHGVDQVDVQPVERHRKHTLEADPVEQRQRPGDFRIPWAPEPVRSARRWFFGDFLIRPLELINLLHVRSLFEERNSTDCERKKPAVSREPGDMGVPSLHRPLPPSRHSSHSPLLHFRFSRPISIGFWRQAGQRP